MCAAREDAPSRGGGDLRDRAIDLLRIGVGLVWALNLVYIVDPRNQWFAGFSGLALSFGSTTVGGPGLPEFVAAHAAVFSWLVAILTGYLAVAFLLGVTTRIACLAGGMFSAVLLATQVGSTFIFPGGTDIGEHPLYLLLYVALVLGGAGRALSVDQWIRSGLAERRRRRAEAPPAFRPTRATATGLNSRFFFAYFAAGTLLAFGVTLGLMVATPASPAAIPVGPGGPVAFENLTVTVNQTNGWPQYSPANFTVPQGVVRFTITDFDTPMNYSGCPCAVQGTVGDTELVNGTPFYSLSGDNVAHSFSIPQLGLSTYSPGGGVVVSFSVDFVNPGKFVWFCVIPCGTGADPYTTPPMGTPGFMTGTVTVG